MTDFDKDTYCTPKYVFNAMNRRFRFDLDACASKENSLCKYFINAELDITKQSTIDDIDCGMRIWMNPPYSNPMPFVKAAIKLMTERDCVVVMLLPADKSTRWFNEAIGVATEVIDVIGGRINFINQVTGDEVKGNNKGSMFVIFDPNCQSQTQGGVTLDFLKMRGGCDA